MVVCVVLFIASIGLVIFGIYQQVQWFKERNRIIRTQRNPHPEDFVNSIEPLYILLCLGSAIYWGVMIF